MVTLYDKIGEKRLKQIIERFYDKIYQSPIAHLFQNDKNEIASKQIAFITQFLGGPLIYSELHGHPRMRARHLPHAIDNTAKDIWLDCMFDAINEVIEDKNLAIELFDCFPRVAQHMVNQ